MIFVFGSKALSIIAHRSLSQSRQDRVENDRLSTRGFPFQIISILRIFRISGGFTSAFSVK